MRGIEVILAWDVHIRKAEITGCDERLRELRRGASPDSFDERDYLIAKRRGLSSEQGRDKRVLRRNGTLYVKPKALPRMI